MIFFGTCGLFISPNPDFLQKEITGLFYLAAELWGPAILTLLFWNFANEVMSVKEAKKTYVLLGVFSQLGMILGGWVAVHRMTEGIAFNYLIGLVTLSGIIIVALHYWINRAIKTDPLIYNSMSEILSEQRSLSSLMNNIIYVLKSPYLWLIIVIMFSHDLLTSLLGIIWKGQVGAQFIGDKSAYNQFMGNSAFISGTIGLFFTIPAYIILARFRWIVSGLLTPILVLITGLIFLGLVSIQGNDSTLPFIGITNLWINRFLVNLPNYSGLFMITLVIAFIPLDQILKNQGRAMVVIMFAPIIKSLVTFVSSQIQMITITKGIPVHISRIPLPLILLIVVVTFWILCVKSLSTRFEALNDVKQG